MRRRGTSVQAFSQHSFVAAHLAVLASSADFPPSSVNPPALPVPSQSGSSAMPANVSGDVAGVGNRSHSGVERAIFDAHRWVSLT